MPTTTTTRPRRLKKVIKEMMPLKKWLSLKEACSYLDMSTNNFQGLNLTVSVVGAKKYYKVSELDGLVEKNILINQHG